MMLPMWVVRKVQLVALAVMRSISSGVNDRAPIRASVLSVAMAGSFLAGVRPWA